MADQKRSKDRNAQQPNNGQMMTELKYLKATLAAKDKRIKELEIELAKLKPAPKLADPVVEVKPALPVPTQP